MALYQNITITDAGSELISRIITTGGDPLTFEAVAIGSGQLATGANPATFTGLITEEKRLPIEAVERAGGRITVSARLATDTLSFDLLHREVGIYANGVLLAYGNTGENYDYIPAAGKNAAVQKTIRIPLAIGTMQTTFAEMDSTDLVTHAALESRIATLVEPAVRSIFTEELTTEAFEQAAREVTQEVAEEANAGAFAAQVKAEAAAAQALVSETNINLALEEVSEHIADDERHVTPYVSKQLDNVVLQSKGGTVSTGESSHEMPAYAFRIDAPPAGKCEKITLNISANAADIDASKPFYLVVLEDDGTGNYSAIAISRERILQIADVSAEYTFSNLVLSGAKIKIAYCQDTSMKSLPDKMGLKVTEANGAGIAYTDKALTVTADYIPALTFSMAAMSTVLYTHTNSQEVHISEHERKKWNTPINAYRRYAESLIQEIPAEDDLSKVIFAGEMCMNCQSFSSVAGLKMPSALNMKKAFYGCPNLKTLDDASFENAEDCESAFENSGLQSCGYGMVFPNLRYARNMFKGSAVVDASNVYCEKLVDGDGMFSGCKLNSVTLEILQETINTVTTGKITLGISSSLQSDSTVQAAISAIRAKGWTVTVEYN